ncbi:MAG: lytic transglycosylase domain-containing protein [Actinobacteria bacterium]|nr:lytic transglycosylase domain-containing protein [Actinomycetota bacterium]MCB8997364.1 lytic transglycosylase domain-containing protein [Actinomycetota bacterium]MCB9414152.1 lytic transglycosylase domain-containing protein [Actinomycetota bacterium]MCB9423671.1 lytic transglycosylase domain-containing protein [Actinomycetota bacterium]HRY11327.1 hypothetical protein [Candidatus Nanopelagicales bacterium]
MPARPIRVGIGVLAVAVPATVLLFATQSAAPAVESIGVAASVKLSAPAQKSTSTALPGPKVWRAAADHADRHQRATRSASPYEFGTVAYNKWFARAYMQQKYGWGADQFSALEQLWQRESGWSQHAHNSSSGAHGIPQALPGSKMGSHGADWATNPETQIKWGLSYIDAVYGSPAGALASSHSRGWY